MSSKTIMYNRREVEVEFEYAPAYQGSARSVDYRWRLGYGA